MTRIQKRDIRHACIASIVLLVLTAAMVDLGQVPLSTPPPSATTYASANPDPNHILSRIRWWVKRHRAAFAGADG